MGVYSNSLKPLGQVKPNFMWHYHGIWGRWKVYSNDLRHLLLFIMVNSREAGVFSRNLQDSEKLKAPLFSCPEGAGDTNDWCNTNA